MFKKNSTVASNWLDSAEEIPRANVVANVDRSKRQRFYRRFIIAAIILLPVSLFANVLILGQVGSRTGVVAEQFTASAEGKAAAILAVEAWLAQDIAPLPAGGRVVSWDGADPVVKPKQTEAESKKNPLPAFEIETHHFTIVDGTGITYTSDVSVAIDKKTGAHVMSTPSAIPNASAADGGEVSGAGPWFGLASGTAPDSVSNAVEAWAKAYTSGDSDALRLAVQDNDGKHSYVPLSNVAAETTGITRAAYLPDPDAPAGTKSSKMVLQVTMTIQWSGSKTPEPGESTPTITMDLLVSNAGGAAPVIVAWGGPGTGPLLAPYANALTGRVAPDAPGSTPTSAPTPTPTKTAGPDSIEGN